MGCIFSGRVEPAAVQKSCEDILDDSEIFKQRVKEYTDNEKKRKKEKRKTDSYSLELEEEPKHRKQYVKIGNFEEDSTLRGENVTASTDGSTAFPSRPRLHSNGEEPFTVNQEQMKSSNKEDTKYVKYEKKKTGNGEKQQKKQMYNTGIAKEVNNSIEDIANEVKRPNTNDEEKHTKCENTAYTADINDKIFRENEIKSVDEISNGKTSSQLKEPDAFRDVQKRETGVIVYQNTTDKEQWDFSDIDRYALQATYHTEMSVETLANQLSNPVQTTLETVRAIYVWITNNIRYDTDELKGDNKRASDPQVVLKLRTCVCTGYARLFEALCSYACVEVKFLQGFSKGSKYSAEKTLTLDKKVDHAWNAVKINKKWFLLDCTWGAKERIHGQESQNGFYFLTDPHHLINTHFPYMNDNLIKSSEWQLLPTPVSIDDFSKNIKLTSQAMQWKIYPKSHKHGIIDMTEPFDIILLDTDEKLLRIKAVFLNMNNGNREETGCIFARKETRSELHIKVRPKSYGKYLLQLYGQTNKNTNKNIMLMKYIIKSLCIPDLRPFPQESGLWGIKPEAYDCGLSKGNSVPVMHTVKRETEIRLQTTKRTPALVQLHSAQNNLNGDEGYVFAESKADVLIIKVRFPFIDYYKLTLYLKPVVNGNDTHQDMAIFMIYCTEPLVPCIPFPKKFSKTYEYNCKIIEPVYRQIPACTKIRFRMKSNILQMANVSGKRMEKVGDEWIVDITFPGAGEVVKINGNVSQDGNWLCLFQYETVECTNEIMKSVLGRFMIPCENMKQSTEQCIEQTEDLNNLNNNHLSECSGLTTDTPTVNDPRTKYAKQWGLIPKSHTSFMIRIEDEVEITAVESMNRLVFTVDFFLESREFVKMNEYIFLRKEHHNEVKVTIRPPSAGTYLFRLFGHIDKESKPYELLLDYTIISSMKGGLVVNPYPSHKGLWGILPEAFTLGLHNDNAYNISSFHTCNRNLEICFRTEQKVYSLSKLEPANNTLLDEQYYTILECTDHYLKVKINFPFQDYFKLTLLFKKSTEETDERRYFEMANFLIDCREPSKPCMPFPKTFGSTQIFSCSLIEPSSRFLPAQSTITFRIKSPIVKTFKLAGEKMERINDEYIAIVTTPSQGDKFRLSGKTEDEEKYWAVYEYEIVSKSGERNNGTNISNIIQESKEWDLLCNYQHKDVLITDLAKELGIQPLSHKGEVIIVHDLVDIMISDIKNCLHNCTATMNRLSDITDIRTEYIFIRKENNREIAVSIRPPPPGIYCLHIYGHSSPEAENLPLLLQYTIKSDGADEDITFPKNDGLWGFLSDANNYGFQNTGAHLVPVKYKVKGEAKLCFPTYRNLKRSVKLTSEGNLPDGVKCTLVDSDNHSFNITLRLPFTGYYKLTIFSETDSKNHKTGTFLIDCTEPANPCLPFPTTFAETQEYNCVLIEPLDGILPANSSVTCRFRSSIILSAIVNGHMMTKEGSEWIITTTTPSTGGSFDIAGNKLDRNNYLVLFRYYIR